MKKTDKQLKQLFRKILFIAMVIAIFGIVVCALVFWAPTELNNYFLSSFVNSETVYIIIALGVMVILSLVALMFSSFKASSELRKEAKKARKANNEAARKEERKRSRKKDEKRFAMLNKIDKDFEKYKEPRDASVTLESLCYAFRGFAAGNLGLYYDISDIRRLIAGMSVTRLILLQGMSGTGKTSLAYALGQFIQNESVVVPIQPMWKERSDMIGYFNEFTKKFNETTLLRKMYEAGYRKEAYITILDEVNISRIEYYFAEFLSLLELPDENRRFLDVVSDVWETDPKKLKDGKVQLPPNMWFIGTANNDDSTFAISDKVYDRAMVLTLDSKCVPFDAQAREGIKLPYSQWCKLFDEARKKYALSRETEQKIREYDKFLIEKFRLSFGNRITKQLREYVPVMIACGGTELGAVDDILSKKVLRKLEQQNPVHVRSVIEELIELTETLFGEELPLCHEYLCHMATNFRI